MTRYPTTDLIVFDPRERAPEPLSISQAAGQDRLVVIAGLREVITNIEKQRNYASFKLDQLSGAVSAVIKRMRELADDEDIPTLDDEATRLEAAVAVASG